MAGLSLSGLASGVDTDTVVQRLINLDRQGINRLNLKGTVAEARGNYLRDIQTRLKAVQSAAANLRSATTWADTQVVESTDPSRLAVTRLGTAVPRSYSLAVQQLATGAENSYTYTPSASLAQISVNGITFDIEANATAAKAASTINGRADSPVYAAVSGNTLVFSTKTLGASSSLTVSGAQLALGSSRGGTDAQFTVDGGPTQTSTSNEVDSAVPGLRLTLKSLTTSAITVTAGAPGVDKALVTNQVKSFVDAYNGLVNTVRSLLSEKSIANPTTETDAKRGALFGDTGLGATLDRLRTAVLDVVSGNPSGSDQLAFIGISTGTASSQSSKDSKKGVLTLDESKLTAALAADSGAVKMLIGGVTGVTGFAQKIEVIADREVGTNGALGARITNSTSVTDRLKTEISDAEKRITAKEKRLRAQFAAMEAALSRSQSQRDWLTAQLGGR